MDVGLQRPFVSFADQKPGSLKVVLIGVSFYIESVRAGPFS